jgi:hypothetical protein
MSCAQYICTHAHAPSEYICTHAHAPSEYICTHACSDLHTNTHMPMHTPTVILQEGTARKKDVFDSPDTHNSEGALSGLFDDNSQGSSSAGTAVLEPFERESVYYHRTDPEDRYGVKVSQPAMLDLHVHGSVSRQKASKL